MRGVELLLSRENAVMVFIMLREALRRFRTTGCIKGEKFRRLGVAFLGATGMETMKADVNFPGIQPPRLSV